MAGNLSDVLLGWEATCTINGVAFGVKGFRVSGAADEHECGDSITGARKTFKPGRDSEEASIDYYEKSDVELGAAPLLIQRGDIIALNVYPDGNTTNARLPYLYPDFIVFSIEMSSDVDGKQQGTIRGRPAAFTSGLDQFEDDVDTSSQIDTADSGD